MRNSGVLTDAELLEADVAARAAALDVRRSFIVQAPAGSGKTELLIQRYLKLLTIVDNPEEVLAITFTRKAAMEMRLRVGNALRNARDSAVSETEHEQRTLDIAIEVLERDGDLDWRLLQSPGRMRIETVDAFGASIARSLPLSSGIGGVGTTLSDASMAALYRSATAATFDWLTTSGATASSVEQLLRHLDNNTSLYISYLARMLATREQWLALVGSGPAGDSRALAARAKLETNIARLIEQQLGKLEKLMPQQCRAELAKHLRYAAKNLAEGENPQHPLTLLQNCGELPASKEADCRAWQAIANLLLIKSGEWRKSINKNDGFPAGDRGQKKELYECIHSLQSEPGLQFCLQRVRDLPPPGYTDEQWQVLLALFNLLPVAAAELTRLFGERGVTDHAEVALAARKALGHADDPGDIALALDYRISHLLVDEMQDTSIGQYDLLKTITAGWTPGDGRTAFCVGDPMQSIYRFRDAEVGEFLLARKNGVGSVKLEPLLLRRNFRSGENLVHWFNTVFSQVLPLQDDISVGAISYSESVPVDSHSGVGDVAIHALFSASAEAEAAHTMSVIKRCHEDHAGDDMAVLVRSRTQLPMLLHELRHAGIAYQAIEIDRLTDLPEVIDVIALTRALCHENDRLAWLALLRSPWVGLTWQELHLLVKNDAENSVLQILADERRTREFPGDVLRRINRFLTVISPLNARNAAGSLRDRVESAWLLLGGPALLSDAGQLENIYLFFDVLDRISVAGTLEDVHELERLLDDERVSSRPNKHCRLQIMTMHKAKGLQFDHVFLHGLGRMTRGSDQDVLSWLFVPDEDGQNEMIISPVGPRSLLEQDPLHKFIAITEKDKADAELDRLLYVACTRAKKSLHLVGHVGVSADGEKYKPPDARSLLRRLWPAIEPVFAAAFEKHMSAEVSVVVEEESRLVMPVLRRLRDEWSAQALPQAPMTRATLMQSLPAAIEKPVEFYWVGSAARHAGTIVHRWLQRISDGDIDIEVANVTSLRPVSIKWARTLGVADDLLDDVCGRVEDALVKIMQDERGRWVLHGEGRAELPITGLYNGSLETIIIDRLRVAADGDHWIVDYKTSTHEGGDLAGFLQQESDRYRPQLQKYATLYGKLSSGRVRAALYFPLLQEFCEVSLAD
jgi:ATP-dependent helicase/nuclease subunit A